MNPLSGLLAPLLAVLPVGVGDGAGLPEAPPALEAAGLVSAADVLATPPAAAPVASGDGFESLRDAARALRSQDAANQVRIEQRIIIRVSPGVRRGPDPRDPRRGLFAGVPARGGGPRIEERRMNQCVPVSAIAGVQPDGASRLVLFLRDQRMVSATLDKACNARDFYSGFLVERSADGMICGGRDKLLSRSGSNCALGKLRQMVVIEDDD